MAEEVRASIMVLAHKDEKSGESKLNLLVERNGIWHDTSALSGSLSVSLKEVRDNADQKLANIMRQVGEKRSRNEPFPAFDVFLKGLFGTQYQGLPTEVQAYLRQAAERANAEGKDAVLRIHMQEGAEWIPWELLHDGEEFLGLRFQVSRLPITVGGPDLNEFKRRQLKVYSLLGENVVSRETDDILMQGWRNTFPDLPFLAERVWRPAEGDPAPDPWPSITHFTQAGKADIIHLTCHGGLKDTRGNIYWSLNPESEYPDNYSIYPDTVGQLGLRSSRPLVFGNACASTSGGNGTGTAGLTPGLGTAFFTHGALNFIGTFAPVTKQIAIEFACQFYKRLLNDQMPVGKALLETKKFYQTRDEHDPSWYFYCMYGPHDTHFVPA
jgi:CHAT domain-containing protein